MTSSINFSVLAQGLSANTGQQQSPKKLQEAAKQFEALMISQMMKSVRESSGGWLSEGDAAGEDSSMGMAEEQFAQSMASNGGLGLAKMVMRTMSKAGAESSSVTSELEKTASKP